MRYRPYLIRSIISLCMLLALAPTIISGVSAKGSPVAPVVYAHVVNPALIVPLPKGQLLVTDFGNFDRTGAQVLITGFGHRLIWRYKGQLVIPHSAYPMTNGDILIADTGNNRVLEVDKNSHIVWDSDDLGKGRGVMGQGTMSDGSKLAYPNDAKPLANGDILISCRLQSRIIEITRTGHIVRTISGFLHEQHNPNPLSNGNMLIADSNADRILEINPKDQIVWEYGGEVNGSDILSWPRDATLMPNGDILITDSNHGRVIEVNSAKQLVRQWTNLSHPYAAVPLPNSNILVDDGTAFGFVELTPTGRRVWKLNQNVAIGKSNLPWRVRNSGFENSVSGASSILSYWKRNDALAYSLPPGKRANMVRDCKVHRFGHCSGRIIYHGDSNGLFLGELVRVQPNHRYRLSGWIKTRNVKPCYPCTYGSQGVHGHTAEFELGFDSSSGTAPPAPALPQYSGTTGWSHDSITFAVPSRINSVSIDCELRGQGTVWFDNVWLQELK